MSKLADEVAKSRHWLDVAMRELPQHCQSVNALVPDVCDQLTEQMQANIARMKKVQAFLDWHSQNPLGRARPDRAESKVASDTE